jgi:tRNA(adenine34) deaminase
VEISVYSHEHFMRQAFMEAMKAREQGEVPVGAVIVCNNRIIARAYNQTETLNDATAHAEMIALTSASNYLGAKYLNNCTMYVSLEPCTMCAGALFWTQIGSLYFAADDPRRGFSLIGKQILHPKTKVAKGILKDECKSLIDDFFNGLRNK